VGSAVAAYNAATMDLTARLDLGDLCLRTLLPDDAALLVAATRHEQAPALWGPRPAGPYSLGDASTALQQWDPAQGERASYGVLRADRLVAALGLMLDSPQSAELAYWVRPEERRRGIGLRSLRALTAWAHRSGGLGRLWLEIEPGNTASLELAGRAGFQLEQRLPRHCRSWLADDPDRDHWHDCLILRIPRRPHASRKRNDVKGASNPRRLHSARAEAGIERSRGPQRAMLDPRGIIRVVERCATPGTSVTTLARGPPIPSDLRR
jgi:RimJ/RimL family protein N-acetyltransferase